MDKHMQQTVGTNRLEQLIAFIEQEHKDNPEKTHIASWALVAIESLKAQVAMLTSVLTRAEDSLSAFTTDEGWSQSDMDNMDAVSAALCSGKNAFVAMQCLQDYDQQVRDAALEDAADEIEASCGAESIYEIADAIRSMKGDSK